MADLTAGTTLITPNVQQSDTRHMAVLIAFCGAVVFALIQVATYAPDGFPSNDDILRLVHARDLLAGQGWYDPVQYRLGLAEGTVMHWSKLIDAPIAALVLVGGETLAAFAWPLLLAFFALSGIAYGAIKLGGNAVALPAGIIGVAALWSIGTFSVGAFDHHNVQAVLLIWSAALLIAGNAPERDAALSAIMCALMLAIGMETLPYVAVIGLWVAGAFAIGGLPRRVATAFGGGLVVALVALFPTLVPPSSWLSRACDAFSSFHVTMGIIGGAGLFLAGQPTNRKAQLGVLGITGLVGVVAVVALFPHCLTNPLADLPPLLRDFWLEGVIETRSAFDIAQSDPFSLLAFFGMSIAAFIVTCLACFRRYNRADAWLFIILLATAISVTIWQQRGFMFAAVLATIPLSVAVTKSRARYHNGKQSSALLMMAALWIVSINIVWFATSAQLAKAFSNAPTLQEQIAKADPRDFCYDANLYGALADEPEGVVLSSTNVGPMILAHTQHRAIAGPYHRNIDGNMLLIETMLGAPSGARAALAAKGVTHIADCVNGPDARDFKNAAPNGFQAQLHQNHKRFDWLELLPESADTPLRIFRVID
ncbi:MAG: hypothetical protein AAFP80_08615 [Pseudomonadota bacterium]